jgi:hypothetical protein
MISAMSTMGLRGADIDGAGWVLRAWPAVDKRQMVLITHEAVDRCEVEYA